MDYLPANAINPDAGVYPITSSPRELEAAGRAAERSLQDAPYYMVRYGEKARRFGMSDGAWLATLCEGDVAYCEDQVLWLGGLLAARGMPRWLMERYLTILHDELVRASPADADRYAVLPAVAERLRIRREAYIPQAEALRLAEHFASVADPGWLALIPEMGWLLVSAVADEADGVHDAVRSVISWVDDPGRFPKTWRVAARSTVRMARRSVRTSSEV